MPKPVAEWDEDYVLSLALEDDTLERKGSLLLDLALPGANENNIRDELAKQLSAFANTGGGRVIYGVSDRGTVDNGGVSRIIRGRQSAKEWLEDVIPNLAEFEIVGVNVYEVLPKLENSAIATDKALYIVDIPDSERAPHQSKRDQRYYIRLGSKSQPASHRIIEDIRNRARHPNVYLARVQLGGVRIPRESLPRIGGALWTRIRLDIENSGHLKSTDTCIYVEVQDPAALFDNFDNTMVRPRRTGKSNALFWELQDPIYPGMEVNFWFDLRLLVELRPPVPTVSPALWVASATGVDLNELVVSWKLFAESAPAKQGTLKVRELDFERHAREAVERDAAGTEILRYYGNSIP